MPHRPASRLLLPGPSEASRPLLPGPSGASRLLLPGPSEASRHISELPEDTVRPHRLSPPPPTVAKNQKALRRKTADKPDSSSEDADDEDDEDKSNEKDGEVTAQAITKLVYTSKHNIALQQLHPKLSHVLRVAYDYIDIGLFTADGFPDYSSFARDSHCRHALRWAAKALKVQPVYNCLKSDHEWTAQLTVLVRFSLSSHVTLLIYS